MSAAPFHFEATLGSAIDRERGLEINRARLLPMEEPNQLEFQFPIYLGDDRYGLGCYGTQSLTEEHGRKLRVFTLDLGEKGTIDSVLQLKDSLEVAGDKLDFLLSFADGLVKAYQGRTDNYDEDLRYYAVSAEASLIDHDIVPPANLDRLANGQLILAAVQIPMHPLPEAKS